MKTVFELPLERMIKESFSMIINYYKLKLGKEHSLYLENDFCRLNFVIEDYHLLNYHLIIKSDKKLITIDLLASVLDNVNYHFKVKLPKTEYESIEEQIRDLLNCWAILTQEYFDKPLNGDFTWKRAYLKRELEINKLVSFIHHNKEGNEARRLYGENDKKWEDLARIEMINKNNF